jgi:uncharacterized protein (TIRG00374 family)
VLVLGAVVAVVAATFLRAWRWRQLFAPHEAKLRLPRAWSIILVGQALNIAVPARLGEVARVFLAAEAAARPKMSVASTIALEKLLDAVTFLIILAATSISMGLPAWLERARGAFAAATLVTLGAAFAVAASRDRFARLLERLPVPDRLGGRAIAARLKPAIDALHSLTSPLAIAVLTMQSLLVWSVAAVVNQLVMLSLGIDTPPVAALFLLVVLQLGTAPPSTPGKLGVFQYLCVLGLAPFGVIRDAAVGCGLLLHLVAYTPPLVAGLLLLTLELRRLRATHVLPEGAPWRSLVRL